MACIVFPSPNVGYPRLVARCHRPCLQRRRGTGRADYLLRELAGADDRYFDRWYHRQLPRELFYLSLLEHLVNDTGDVESEKKTEKSQKSCCKADETEEICPSATAEEAETTEKAEASQEAERPENFKLVVSVGNFKPEDLKLSVRDGKLSVAGKYVRELDHGDGVYSTEERHFRQTYTLPENVDTDQLTSNMGENGLLAFEAPLRAVEPPKERLIPITVEKKSPESLDGGESESAAGDEKPTQLGEKSESQQSLKYEFESLETEEDKAESEETTEVDGETV